MNINYHQGTGVSSLCFGGSYLNSEYLRFLNNSNGLDSKFSGFIEKSRQNFVNKFITPMRNTFNKLKNSIITLQDIDIYKPLICKEDFINVPFIMYDSILRFQPVRNLHQNDELFGFGVDPSKVLKKDPYSRLIQNGYCSDLLGKLERGKELVCFSHFELIDDPKLSFTDLDAIRDTRDYILKLLKEDFDPTDV